MGNHDVKYVLWLEVMVDEHPLSLERLDDFAQSVNALEGVEIQAKDELRLIQDKPCPGFLPGEHDKFPYTWNELQRLGSHIGRDHDSIFAQSPKDMAQRQGRAQGIPVGRLVAGDGDALHAIDKGTQAFDGRLVYN